MFCASFKTHTFPYSIFSIDTVAIGGTRQRDDEDTHIREHEHTDIWNRACDLMPSLKVGVAKRTLSLGA